MDQTILVELHRMCRAESVAKVNLAVDQTREEDQEQGSAQEESVNLAVDQNSLVELPRMPCLSDQTILAHQQGSAQEEETVLAAMEHTGEE